MAEPTPAHLKGVFAKLARAKDHAQVLHDHIARYLNECSETVSPSIEINSDQNAIRLRFEPLPEPDVFLSVIIGDCVHNARSTLDHLWKRLNGSGNFPVFSDIDSTANWHRNKASKLAGVDIAAHAIIDGLQPCHRGKDAPFHPLFVLNKLSNTDKHEAIHLTKPHSTNTEYTFKLKGSDTIGYVVRPPVVFHDHTEVIIRDVPADVLYPNMDVGVKGTLFVALEKSGPWAVRPIDELLNLIILCIEEMVVAPLVPFTK